jgi:glycosyltransferase involved in cell wall biosynthesis
MPLLSVIIPAYNRAKLLAEALESLVVQECADFEVIAVNDGSTDDTASVLARYEQGPLRGKLRVLHQENAGQGAARNLALAAAQGEYCSFLDSDDRYFPWSVAVIVDAILGNDRPSVVIGTDKQFETNEQFASVIRKPARMTRWPDVYSYLVTSHLGPCGIFVARTQLLREAGGFLIDRIVGEDADLMFRVGTAPRMVKIESPWMFAYRVHDQSFTRSYEKWYRGGLHFIRQYRNGNFPGGRERQAALRKATADAVAAFGFFTLHLGGRRQCIDVYLRTVWLQLRAGNYDYVCRTPVLIILSYLHLWPWHRLVQVFEP